MEPIETLLMPILTVLFSLSASWIVLRRTWNRPPSWVSDLFEPIDEKGTTKLDTWITRAVDTLFAKMKYSVMGEASGPARLDKGLQNAMLDDVINGQSPIFGMILDQFPQVRGYIIKHPQVLPQVLQMVGPMVQGGKFKGFGVAGSNPVGINPFEVK